MCKGKGSSSNDISKRTKECELSSWRWNLGQGNVGRTGLVLEEWSIEVGSPTKEQSCHRSQVGLQDRLDRSGKVVRNKAELVAICYSQQEGIDFNETYTPVAHP